MTDLMDFIVGFARLLGSLICHQLPSRTLFIDGRPLPVCARDTGIYLGIFISTMIILLLGRYRADRLPAIPVAMVMCALMIPMIVDGAGSYLGVYETNNTLRLFTGAFFGISVPIFLIPAANFKLTNRNENVVLKSFTELAGVTAAVLLLCVLILSGYIPYIIMTVIFTISFLFLIWRISYTVIARGFRLKPLHTNLVSTGAMICILSVLYLFSTMVLQPLKAVFLR